MFIWAVRCCGSGLVCCCEGLCVIVVLWEVVVQVTLLGEMLLQSGGFRALLIFVGSVVVFVCGWVVLEGVDSAPPRSCGV